jgi:hypothetical protein
LSPTLSVKNFCLDVDGDEPTTANFAVQLNVPQVVLAFSNGEWLFGSSVTSVAVSSNPTGGTGALGLTFTRSDGSKIEGNIYTFPDASTSATREEPDTGSEDPVRTTHGRHEEYIANPQGTPGPMTSKPTTGVSPGANDIGREGSCTAKTQTHSLLAAGVNDAITFTLKGFSGSSLPVSSGLPPNSGVQVNGNSITIQRAADYIVPGSSP